MQRCRALSETQHTIPLVGTSYVISRDRSPIGNTQPADFHVMDKRPTPFESLLNAYRLGEEAGLRYIYMGNVPGEAAPTRCPNYWKPVIPRNG